MTLLRKILDVMRSSVQKWKNYNYNFGFVRVIFGLKTHHDFFVSESCKLKVRNFRVIINYFRIRNRVHFNSWIHITIKSRHNKCQNKMSYSLSIFILFNVLLLNQRNSFLSYTSTTLHIYINQTSNLIQIFFQMPLFSCMGSCCSSSLSYFIYDVYHS